MRTTPIPTDVSALLAAAVLSTFIGAAAAPDRAAAQSLRGEVVDAATGERIAAAAVTVRDTSGAVLGEALTGGSGTFAVVGVPAGILQISVEAFGFETETVERVEFDGQPTFLSIVVDPAPVRTEGITATVTRQRPHLRASGFYDRLQKGHGAFVTEEQISRLQPVRASDLLSRVPSLKLVRGEPVLGRGGIGFNQNLDCAPTVWVDGMLVRQGTSVRGRHSPGAFDNLLPMPEQIRVIEVYSGGAGTPPQWGGVSSGCGVIVVWLKH